ncbi:MAG: hypothetical protein GTN76_16020 [Candidatus Aenigmarchaeota archaeon]|nr:hypothetical protein [Candidatus Aenigmarchaeota archaeon]
MSKNQTGVAVNRVAYGSSSWGIVQEGDVILAIHGIDIANDGTVPFAMNDRLDFPYLLVRKHFGERVKLRILRQEQIEEVTLVLKGKVDIIPRYEYDLKPTYYIFGGLVFTKLTFDYYWEKGYKSPALANHLFSDIRTPEREEIVVLGSVLADTVNSGYHDYKNEVVEEINGRPVSDMRDLVEKIENLDSPYLLVGLENREKIALEIERCREVNSHILEQYGIPSDRSDNLR